MFYDENAPKGRGYIGHSMSVNAARAYARDEKPLSKWTKADILTAFEIAVEENKDAPALIAAAKRLPSAVLRENLLRYTCDHHTSRFYNATAFYAFSWDAAETATTEWLARLLEMYKANQAATKDQRAAEKVQKEIAAQKRREEKRRLEALKVYFKCQNKYKTFTKFVQYGTLPDQLAELEAVRLRKIADRRAYLLDVWSRQGYIAGLKNLEDPDYVAQREGLFIEK